MMRIRRAILTLILLGLCAMPSLAQQFPPASVINDEGGPVAINGIVTYTNPFFTTGSAAPLIILEDQAGFVDRNESFLFPPESQALGQITSDFYTSPFTYSLALPVEPRGSLRDVDQDGQTDSGVMVFAVAYWENIWGDPFLEKRDQQGGGWSTAYASTIISDNPETLREIEGGKYLIYAPDDGQGFPSGFGADAKLFTADDPMVTIPRGYSVVNLDAEPFTFDRSRIQDVELFEPEGAALVDFSAQSYTAAFDSMVEKFRNEYAFNEFKGLDWDSVVRKYRPRFEEAERNADGQAYLDALSDVIWSVPDGHVNVSPFDLFVDRVRTAVEGGLGFTLRETDNRESYVVFVSENSAAAQAGIQVGAQIIAINERPVADWISRVNPISETYSTPHNRRLGQARWATRFPLSTPPVTVEYINPGAGAQVITLTVETEFDSFFYSPAAPQTGWELPVEYTVLDSGVVYVKIFSFFDNQLLSIQLWERMLRQLNEQGGAGLIIDMRENGGGSSFLADQMAAYFFTEEKVVGKRGAYNKDLGQFFFDPRSDSIMYPPSVDMQYLGKVVVLIGPDCASACERFAYNLTIDDRAEVIGYYPTAGLGGGVEDFAMPDGVTIRMTVVRSTDMDGKIHIEGTGVAPTLRIPVTRETLFATEDVLLQAAESAILGQ